MIIALDFATRRVIETTTEDAKIRERLLQDSVEHLKKVQEIYKNIQRQSEQKTNFQQSINQVRFYLGKVVQSIFPFSCLLPLIFLQFVWL